MSSTRLAGAQTLSSTDSGEASIPAEPLGRLFLRFLRFGALAWGGPVAQIAMIRQELVEEARWVNREHFNRVLAVYQVLPGPEAHELCVYFGMRSRGRIGGLLAGLGFMLPGFILMFALSWAYLRFGFGTPRVEAVFGAVQAAVAALIVRAIFRIGEHVLTDRWLWGIGVLGAVGQLAGLHFALTLTICGLAYLIVRRGSRWVAAGLAVAFLCGAVVFAWKNGLALNGGVEALTGDSAAPSQPTLPELLWSGLRSGMLTFGGAYTVIPFLQRDAVVVGGWMTNGQFLDGLALSGVLPAPLIIFSTFVGFMGGGALGALVLTIGIFFPAFAFTLLGHDFFERALHQPRIRLFLDGVTAGVVGLIAATTLGLLIVSVKSVLTAIIFAGAVAALFRWKSKFLIPAVVVASALVGVVASFV